jgi:hypothetical protein
VLMTSKQTRAPPSRPTSSRMNGACGRRGRVRPGAGWLAGLAAGLGTGFVAAEAGLAGLAGLEGLAVGLVPRPVMGLV